MDGILMQSRSPTDSKISEKCFQNLSTADLSEILKRLATFDNDRNWSALVVGPVAGQIYS